MKESMWGYLLLGLGILIIIVMMLIHSYTSTSEQDYYLAKEAMEAAMLDAVDYGVYAKYGDLRIIESKFVENFIRRFSDSVNNNKDYKIEFYEVYEFPPKATVKISTNTGSYRITAETTADLDVVTTVSGIIGTKYSTFYNTENTSTFDVKMKVYGGRVYYSNKISIGGNGVSFETKPHIQGDTLDIVTCTDGTDIYTLGSTDKIELDKENPTTILIKNISSDMQCTASYHYNGDYRVGFEEYDYKILNSSFESDKVTYTLSPNNSKAKLETVVCAPVNKAKVEFKNNVVTITDIQENITCRAKYVTE